MTRRKVRFTTTVFVERHINDIHRKSRAVYDTHEGYEIVLQKGWPLDGLPAGWVNNSKLKATITLELVDDV